MISVDMARKAWTEALQEQYDKAEKLIDAAISSSDDMSVSVDVSTATKDRRVIDRLRTAYEDGGWSVTVASADQRDPGVWFKLHVSGPPRSGHGGA